VGTITTPQSTFHLVRNTGGGTSACCHDFPEAGGAKVLNSPGASAFELELQPRGNRAARNGARVYLATRCENTYDRHAYASIPLLGKTFSFTVDLSQTDCGCNAAMYLVSMRQNQEPGLCDGDYYCDANQICGTRCAEIDLMEANQHAFKTTVHTANDGAGKASGLGGGDGAFTKEQYGPGGSPIDTTQPFRVHVYFAVSNSSSAESARALAAIEVTLWGAASESLTFSLSETRYLQQLTGAVASGMTPTFSYWSGWDLGWLDSGPCRKDDQDSCGDWVKFSDISVTEGRIEGRISPSPPQQNRPRIGHRPPGVMMVAWADNPPPSPLPPPNSPSQTPLLPRMAEQQSQWIKILTPVSPAPPLLSMPYDERKHQKHLQQHLKQREAHKIQSVGLKSEEMDSTLLHGVQVSGLPWDRNVLLPPLLLALLASVSCMCYTKATRLNSLSRVPTSEPVWCEPPDETWQELQGGLSSRAMVPKVDRSVGTRNVARPTRCSPGLAALNR